MRLTQIIESLLFASESPLSAVDLSRVDERLDEDTVEAVIQELRAEYELSERSFQIYEVAGGYQLLTRPEFVAVLERYDSVPQPARLSAPALEVLAILAYRQPIGRAEVEDIRGVGSSGVLRTLVERELVAPVGRSEGLGRPLLYGTTKKFLEHFGFRSLEDLPRPDELPVVLRERTTTEPADAAPDAPQDQDAGAQAGADTPADPPVAEAGDVVADTASGEAGDVGTAAVSADAGDVVADVSPLSADDDAAIGDAAHPAEDVPRSADDEAPVLESGEARGA
jgi:segregation and condensation protein B